MECWRRNLQRWIKTGTTSWGCFCYITYCMSSCYATLSCRSPISSTRYRKKIIVAMRKVLLVSNPSCTLFFTCILHGVVYPIFEIWNTQVPYQKNPTSISFLELTFGNSLSVWLKPQCEQHVIKFIGIYCSLTINQVSEPGNILMQSVTTKSLKMQH